MNKILVYGAGGLGRGIIELLESINKSNPNTWEIVGFVDDQATGVINEYSVWGTTEDLLKIDESISVVLAVGNPKSKKSTYSKLKKNHKINYPNIIHPSVENSKFNKIGIGNVISKGVVMSTNIKLNNFNLIHYNSSVGHDVALGNYNSVFPLTSLSGYVVLNDEVEVGANSTILPSIEINNNVIIGAGSVVNKNITADITVAGVPIKKLD